jgi:hypothetical protein
VVIYAFICGWKSAVGLLAVMSDDTHVLLETQRAVRGG